MNEVNYPKHILIVKLSSLGDIVQSLPVATVLHRQFPGLELTWIVNRQYIELLKLVPDIDRIIPFERNRWGSPINLRGTLREFRGFIKYIQTQRFDLVLDLQGLFRSGLITFLSKVPIRIGFRNAREGAILFYNYRVKVPGQRRHAVERYLTLTEYLGCEYKAPVFNINVPSLDATSGLGIPELFRKKGPYIAINPGGRWLTKKWPAQRFAQLIDRLNKRYKINIMLIGDEDDKTTARDIVNRVNSPITDLTGETSLLQLAGVLKLCTLLITNDSGSMHLASALGKPIVALFGPTDPRLTGPWGKENRIIKSKVSCSPCFKKKCPLSSRCPSGLRQINRGIRYTQPLQEGAGCMEAITVEEVFGAVEDILQKQRGVI